MKTRISMDKAIEMIRTNIEIVPMITLNDLMVASMGFGSKITNDDFNSIAKEMERRNYK